MEKLRVEAENVHDIMFGSMDGMISTLAVISGVAGATSNNFIVLVAGLSALLAEAISMGFSSYMSDKLREGILATKKIRDSEKPLDESVTILVATLVGGGVILLPFILSINQALLWSVVFAGFLLFGMGSQFSKLAKRSALLGGIETMTFGMFAAAITYMVGYAFAMLA